VPANGSLIGGGITKFRSLGGTLDDATLGALSLSRRAELLSGLQAQLVRVWESTSYLILFASRQKYPVPSRMTNSPSPGSLSSIPGELVGRKQHGARLIFGARLLTVSLGCGCEMDSHGSLEEYEHRFFPRGQCGRLGGVKTFWAVSDCMAGGEASAAFSRGGGGRSWPRRHSRAQMD